MPSVAVKLYSVFFKFLLKHRLQNRIQSPLDESDHFGVTTRPEESVSAPNPSFTEGVATKDIHIDPFTSLSIRIFLPESALNPPEPDSRPQSKPKPRANSKNADADLPRDPLHLRRNSYGSPNAAVAARKEEYRRSSYSGRGSADAEAMNLNGKSDVYRGYAPVDMNRRKLPVMLQFHGGGWVSGSKDSVANDYFCRRIARLCDVIVVAVGYRLAPENRFPAAFEDGMKVLHWLGKQANLAECSKSMGNVRGSATEFKKADGNRHLVDGFGSSVVEPWLAAHGDPSRSDFALI